MRVAGGVVVVMGVVTTEVALGVVAGGIARVVVGLVEGVVGVVVV